MHVLSLENDEQCISRVSPVKRPFYKLHELAAQRHKLWHSNKITLCLTCPSVFIQLITHDYT